MKNKSLYILSIAGLFLISTASNCKKPKTNPDAKPKLTLQFNPLFNGGNMELRSAEYTKADGEVIKLNNWGILLSKVSLINSADGSLVPLGDGYLWIDFYTKRTKFSYSELPEGSYSGISLQFGLDSLINHGDPNTWAADHPLNPNLTGMHWGWAGGYIFQVIDGQYKVNKDSTKLNAFSYHAVGDQMKRTFKLNYNFTLSKNTNKTATIELDFDEFFKNPTAIKIGDDANNHSGSSGEISWMMNFISNGADVYKLVKVE